MVIFGPQISRNVHFSNFLLRKVLRKHLLNLKCITQKPLKYPETSNILTFKLELPDSISHTWKGHRSVRSRGLTVVQETRLMYYCNFHCPGQLLCPPHPQSLWKGSRQKKLMTSPLPGPPPSWQNLQEAPDQGRSLLTCGRHPMSDVSAERQGRELGN